jgi:hypothetical protein
MANADLAKAKNCMACHAVANKVVGPAYKDVAAKYAGQKDAEDKPVHDAAQKREQQRPNRTKRRLPVSRGDVAPHPVQEERPVPDDLLQ